METDRRSFLKTGALAAAPLAAVAAPVAVLAGDEGGAGSTRLEDERAIAALHTAFLRRVNGAGDCSAYVASAGAVTLDPGLRTIADDHARDGSLKFADDGWRASSRRPVHVEIETELAGHSTVEQMTRFQGHGAHRRRETRTMSTDYAKDANGWHIARLTIA